MYKDFEVNSKSWFPLFMYAVVFPVACWQVFRAVEVNEKVKGKPNGYAPTSKPEFF